MAIGKTNATTIIGGGAVSGHKVQWFDIDGTILKTEYVANGTAATPPTVTPNYDPTYLVFNSYNRTYSNITAPTNIGAMYSTVDNKQYLFITVNASTGYDIVLYMNKNNTNVMTINWGDSTSSTFTNSGNFNTGTHTYPAYGNYIVSISVASTGTFRMGNGTTSTTFLGGNTQSIRNMLTKLYISTQCTTSNAGELYAHSNLSVISLRYNHTSYYNTSSYQNTKLYCVNFPISSGLIGQFCFDSCYYTKYLNFGNSNTLGYQTFNANYGLQEIYTPSSITTFDVNLYSACYGINKIVLESTTPPTLNSSALTISAFCKIYVPDSAVDTYKAASGWSTYANQIFGFSSL